MAYDPLTDEQREIRDLVRTLARERVAPRAAEIDKQGEFPWDMEAQVERFAPGFRDLILARSSIGPADFERRNRNLVGGDINGGLMDLHQLFFRPVRKLVPYRTPVKGLYLCSSSTPPGGGVHGMCGYSAALVALRDS